MYKNGHCSARLCGALLTPSSGRDCPGVPTDISHAADSRLSRTMVETSPPSSRVRTAAGPNLTLDIAAKSWLSGAAGGPPSAVPGSGLLRSLTLVLYRNKICFVCSEPGAHPLSSLLRLGATRVGLPVPSAGSLHLDPPQRGRTPCSISFIAKGVSVCVRWDHKPSIARLTVLLCICAIQRPSGVYVSGGSNRHSGRSVRTVSQLSSRTPSWPTNRKAKAWSEGWRHLTGGRRQASSTIFFVTLGTTGVEGCYAFPWIG